MGGSKGGKHLKGKGKSKSKKNETSPEKSEPINFKCYLTQTSNVKVHSRGNMKAILAPWAPGSSKYKEKELELILSKKLEDLYTEAKGWLLTSGYGTVDIERAILNKNNWYVNGPKVFLNNILRDIAASVEQKEEAKGEACKDTKELCKAMLETMIDSVLHTDPHLQRSDAMWLILARNWGSVPSTSTSPPWNGDDNTDSIIDASYVSNSHNSNEGGVPDISSSTVEKVQTELNIESSSKKVRILERINSAPALVSQIKRDISILRASVQKHIGTTFIKQQDIQNAGCAPIEGSNFGDPAILTFLDEACIKKWQENSSNDMKTAFILNLIESIRNLQDKLNAHKEWAHAKVVDSARRLSRDLLELNILKIEKVEMRCMKNKSPCVGKSSMLMLNKTDQSLINVNSESRIITDTLQKLEAVNAQTKADTEAIRLTASDYGDQLNQLRDREMQWTKKNSTIGKEITSLRANCDEEKWKVLQLQQDVFQAEEETKEAELIWKQETREKERMSALLAEETRMIGRQRANLRAELVRLLQELDTNRNLKMDEARRLEEELSHQRMFQQMSDVSLEGDTFLYNGIEVTSIESSLPCENSGHWTCMLCLVNEVSIVLLPCTHQVMCTSCYETCRSFTTGICPCCYAEIQDIIKVHGR